MKQFFLHVLEVVAALCMFFFVLPIILIIIVAIASAGSSGGAEVEAGSILRIPLTTVLSEQKAEGSPMDMVMNKGKDDATSGLDVLLQAINEAKTNDKIAGIYLEGGALSADFAQLQELREALADFKSSGKFIGAYAEQYSQSGYYIASVADTIMLNPEGLIDWHGIASVPTFYTETLEKLGVKMQVFKVGTFKSAVEPFILTEMSDANRLQVEAFINDIWDTVVADVADGRHITSDSLRSYASQYMALARGARYVETGMVDTLVYVDGAREWLRRHAKKGEVKFAEASDVAALAKQTEASDRHVAVYYATGDIVDVAGTGAMLGGSSEIVGSKVVEDLDLLANDDNVKAVVLRINSGGGSANASEQMWRGIQLLKAKKPVVVSMSGMAASGGYYMSCGADYVVADASTLTGSIGIFGMIPDASGLLTGKVGLHYDLAATNEGADFGSTAGRPFRPAECAAMQRYVEQGYDLFTRRVADGRGMTQQGVDSIGQGRVWTGRQALAIGLVDTLGSLRVAVEKARELANDPKIKGTVAYPAKASIFEQLVAEATGDKYMERKVRELLGDMYEPLVKAAALPKQSRLQARVPFELRVE